VQLETNLVANLFDGAQQNDSKNYKIGDGIAKQTRMMHNKNI